MEACKHVYPGDWEPFGSRKLPDGAYAYSTTSAGARRAYVMLDDVRLRIYTPAKVLTLQKKDGKLVAETEALREGPQPTE